MKGKKIVIGITGSIAAYKIPLLVRLFKKEGAEVQIVMTPSACDFVTPLTLSTLSQRPVWTQAFDPVSGDWNSHVELGHWADVMLIAPASANTLAKMVNGLVDNILLTTYLAAKCPVFFAPAMDLDMYHHPSTQANIRKLQEYGNHLIAPTEGELASGLCGAGRLEEPEVIFSIISGYLKKKSPLNGKRLLVTAGPTHEAIDPVRFIGNHSSGLMGFALAEAAARMGADVTLVAGPVNLKVNEPSIHRIDVKTAAEMANACLNAFPGMDCVIMAAAVADYAPVVSSPAKIKKQAVGEKLVIELESTTDILAEIGKRKQKGQVVVGFALETDHEQRNALQKLRNKNADAIVLNSLNDAGAAFGQPTNRVQILSDKAPELLTPLLPKAEIARIILQYIAEHLF